EAAPLYQRCLSIFKAKLPAGHSSIKIVQENYNGLQEKIARQYYTQEKYAEAERLYERLLVTKEKKLGTGHPSLANIMNSLGVCCYKQKNYAKAEPLYKRVLAINEVAEGKNSLSVAINLNNIAEIYRHQEKYDEAGPLFQRALSILKNYPDEQATIKRIQEHYDDLKKSREAENKGSSRTAPTPQK
ncbi:MAG: tetratricopeptide repeat protein, partial [Candidatus Electrothrix sp. AR1]|nr:tetratricopeptide repeat protein [Candidatus Electrothrix sp. AR1]